MTGKPLRVVIFVVLLFAFDHPMAKGGTEAHLFVIERSLNANTVVYDVATDNWGQPELAKPLRVYWIMLADRGQIEELNSFERAGVFGYDVHSCKDYVCDVTLCALKSRPIRIELGNNPPQALTMIGGEEGILRRVFVRLGRRGVFPHVESIDLYGVSRESGTSVFERITSH